MAYNASRAQQARTRFDRVTTTSKTFANSSPGLPQPWVNTLNSLRTLKEFLTEETLSAFQILNLLSPGLRQPWAQISKRLRRIGLASFRTGSGSDRGCADSTEPKGWFSTITRSLPLPVLLIRVTATVYGVSVNCAVEVPTSTPPTYASAVNIYNPKHESFAVLNGMFALRSVPALI